jgi:hypothetical protein
VTCRETPGSTGGVETIRGLQTVVPRRLAVPGLPWIVHHLFGSLAVIMGYICVRYWWLTA